MNRHPPFLGLLGILPNQLRTLLKETGHENREEALLDLSHTLFFAGYRVWEKRQKLAAKYYRNITKVQFNGIIKRKKRKKNYNADEKFRNQIVAILFITFVVMTTYQSSALPNALVETSFNYKSCISTSLSQCSRSNTQ